MLAQDIEDICSERVEQDKTWVPKIWPHQCSDNDEGISDGKVKRKVKWDLITWDSILYGTQ